MTFTQTKQKIHYPLACIATCAQTDDNEPSTRRKNRCRRRAKQVLLMPHYAKILAFFAATCHQLPRHMKLNQSRNTALTEVTSENWGIGYLTRTFSAVGSNPTLSAKSLLGAVAHGLPG